MIQSLIKIKLIKIESLPEILRDIAQVFFASVFIGPIMSGNTNKP
jgi:hypothetical protein